MKAYKFLRPGRVGPFSEFVWPEGTWVDTGSELEQCRAGVHACRLEQLAYWLAEELWEIELDGVQEEDLQVIASRGRLLGRVTTWDDEARSDFAAECVRRAASYAAAELREVGLVDAADTLAGAHELDDLTARAQEASEAAAEVVGAGSGADLAGYVADAAAYAAAGDTVGTAFVAAHAAFVHQPLGVDDPFRAERAEQATFLARRLGLRDDG
jgi:hypothetical protein